MNGNAAPYDWWSGETSLTNIVGGAEIKQTGTFGTWPSESATGWTAASGSQHACLTYLKEN